MPAPQLNPALRRWRDRLRLRRARDGVHERLRCPQARQRSDEVDDARPEAGGHTRLRPAADGRTRPSTRQARAPAPRAQGRVRRQTCLQRAADRATDSHGWRRSPPHPEPRSAQRQVASPSVPPGCPESAMARWDRPDRRALGRSPTQERVPGRQRVDAPKCGAGRRCGSGVRGTTLASPPGSMARPATSTTESSGSTPARRLPVDPLTDRRATTSRTGPSSRRSVNASARADSSSSHCTSSTATTSFRSCDNNSRQSRSAIPRHADRHHHRGHRGRAEHPPSHAGVAVTETTSRWVPPLPAGRSAPRRQPLLRFRRTRRQHVQSLVARRLDSGPPQSRLSDPRLT